MPFIARIHYFPMNADHGMRAKTLVLGVVLCLAAFKSPAVGQGRAHSAENGHWWLSLATGEREGFVAGFVDCHRFSSRSDTFGQRSLARYRELTTEAFTKDSTRQLEEVGKVILGLRGLPSDEPWLKGGETHPGAHSYFDGIYWMQIGGDGPEKRRGFVEGYLHCLADVPGTSKFSKAADTYQQLVTHWYGLDREAGDDPYEQRADTAVADVLIQYCDTCRAREEKP